MLSRWDHYPILVEGNPSGDAKGQTKIVVSSKKGLIRVILGQFDAWKSVFYWDRSVWNQVILFESQTGSDMWRQLVRVWAQKRRIRRRSRRHNSIGGQSWTLLSLLLLPDHDEEVEKFDNKCLKVESKCFWFRCTFNNLRTYVSRSSLWDGSHPWTRAFAFRPCIFESHFPMKQMLLLLHLRMYPH